MGEVAAGGLQALHELARRGLLTAAASRMDRAASWRAMVRA